MEIIWSRGVRRRDANEHRTWAEQWRQRRRHQCSQFWIRLKNNNFSFFCHRCWRCGCVTTKWYENSGRMEMRHCSSCPSTLHSVPFFCFKAQCYVHTFDGSPSFVWKYVGLNIFRSELLLLLGFKFPEYFTIRKHCLLRKYYYYHFVGSISPSCRDRRRWRCRSSLSSPLTRNEILWIVYKISLSQIFHTEPFSCRLEFYRNSGEKKTRVYFDRIVTKEKQEREWGQYLEPGARLTLHISRNIPTERMTKYAQSTPRMHLMVIYINFGPLKSCK